MLHLFALLAWVAIRAPLASVIRAEQRQRFWVSALADLTLLALILGSEALAAFADAAPVLRADSGLADLAALFGAAAEGDPLPERAPLSSALVLASRLAALCAANGLLLLHASFHTPSAAMRELRAAVATGTDLQRDALAALLRPTGFDRRVPRQGAPTQPPHPSLQSEERGRVRRRAASTLAGRLEALSEAAAASAKAEAEAEAAKGGEGGGGGPVQRSWSFERRKEAGHKKTMSSFFGWKFPDETVALREALTADIAGLRPAVRAVEKEATHGRGRSVHSAEVAALQLSYAVRAGFTELTRVAVGAGGEAAAGGGAAGATTGGSVASGATAVAGAEAGAAGGGGVSSRALSRRVSYSPAPATRLRRSSIGSVGPGGAGGGAAGVGGAAGASRSLLVPAAHTPRLGEVSALELAPLLGPDLLRTACAARLAAALSAYEEAIRALHAALGEYPAAKGFAELLRQVEATAAEEEEAEAEAATSPTASPAGRRPPHSLPLSPASAPEAAAEARARREAILGAAATVLSAQCLPLPFGKLAPGGGAAAGSALPRGGPHTKASGKWARAAALTSDAARAKAGACSSGAASGLEMGAAAGSAPALGVTPGAAEPGCEPADAGHGQSRAAAGRAAEAEALPDFHLGTRARGGEASPGRGVLEEPGGGRPSAAEPSAPPASAAEMAAVGAAQRRLERAFYLGSPYLPPPPDPNTHPRRAGAAAPELFQEESGGGGAWSLSPGGRSDGHSESNAVLAALGDWLVALCEYDHASLGYVRYADLPAARYGEKEQAEWRALLQDAEGSLCAADALSVRLYFGTRPELCRMADSLAGVADPLEMAPPAGGRLRYTYALLLKDMDGFLLTSSGSRARWRSAPARLAFDYVEASPSSGLGPAHGSPIGSALGSALGGMLSSAARPQGKGRRRAGRRAGRGASSRHSASLSSEQGPVWVSYAADFSADGRAGGRAGGRADGRAGRTGGEEAGVDLGAEISWGETAEELAAAPGGHSRRIDEVWQGPTHDPIPGPIRGPIHEAMANPSGGSSGARDRGADHPTPLAPRGCAGRARDPPAAQAQGRGRRRRRRPRRGRRGGCGGGTLQVCGGGR